VAEDGFSSLSDWSARAEANARERMAGIGARFTFGL